MSDRVLTSIIDLFFVSYSYEAQRLEAEGQSGPPDLHIELIRVEESLLSMKGTVHKATLMVASLRNGSLPLVNPNGSLSLTSAYSYYSPGIHVLPRQQTSKGKFLSLPCYIALNKPEELTMGPIRTNRDAACRYSVTSPVGIIYPVCSKSQEQCSKRSQGLS